MKDCYLVLSYFIIWPIIMVGSSYLFYKIPRSFFDPNFFIFKTRALEKNGELYENIFLIKAWKHLLPDGSALFKDGFKKKKLQTFSLKYLEQFVYESCRAEASHIPPIFFSFIFALYNKPSIVLIMFLFGLITNLPCILAQRYNRIRIINILKRKYNLNKKINLF